MNVALLRTLRGAGGAFVPIASLGDPAEIGRDLDELEAFGFLLERHPYRGAAYRGPADRLCPDQIEWDLGTARIGRRVAVWDRVGSTNDAAARAAGSVANDGLVVLAEEQTAGRGRRGRSWSASPRSALLMSALIFPPAALGDVGWLTALGAVAAAEVAESATGLPARIKWPNDVLLGGRKVAGILVERHGGSVVGIGLNVNAKAGDLPDELRATATSLRIATGERMDRSELARELIRRLDHHYGVALGSGTSALNAAWRSLLDPIGRPVRLATHSGAVSGLLTEADLSSGLTLTAEDGRVIRVANAEVLAFDAEPDGSEPA